MPIGIENANDPDSFPSCSDGVLKLSLPLGAADANADVVITIQTANSFPTTEEKQPWDQFLDDTFGSCAELDLQRGSQGEYETREALD